MGVLARRTIRAALHFGQLFRCFAPSRLQLSGRSHALLLNVRLALRVHQCFERFHLLVAHHSFEVLNHLLVNGPFLRFSAGSVHLRRTYGGLYHGIFYLNLACRAHVVEAVLLLLDRDDAPVNRSALLRCEAPHALFDFCQALPDRSLVRRACLLSLQSLKREPGSLFEILRVHLKMLQVVLQRLLR